MKVVKLTKRGYSAMERAIINEEGIDDEYEFSPYKKAIEYDNLFAQIKGHKSPLPSMLLTARKISLNSIIKYFNKRGWEFYMINKPIN